nr:hypothetical protein Ade03nite_61010 [Actinoplanes derwentensis]
MLACVGIASALPNRHGNQRATPGAPLESTDHLGDQRPSSGRGGPVRRVAWGAGLVRGVAALAFQQAELVWVSSPIRQGGKV